MFICKNLAIALRFGASNFFHYRVRDLGNKEKCLNLWL